MSKKISTILSSNVNATSVANIAGGVAGSIPYQSAPGVTGFIPAGTTGQVLQSNGAAAPSWTDATFAYYQIQALIVAGGGAGGAGDARNCSGGGGGAGGVIFTSILVNSSKTYSIVIGSGGVNAYSSDGNGGHGTYVPSATCGNNSTLSGVFPPLTAFGGGGGGNNSIGLDGGSGGGAGRANGSGAGDPQPLLLGGLSTSGQGYKGGGTIHANASGGGGGAGSVGIDAIGLNSAGGGGTGVTYSSLGITSAIAYGGGSQGWNYSSTSGNGIGHGGQHASANTGIGADGGNYAVGMSCSGGSGVVVLSIPTANYTGIKTGSPIVTVVNTNTILTFNTSGSYTA